MITPELAEVIKQAMKDELLDVHTSIPVQVEAVNDGTVDCVIQLKRPIENKDGDIQLESLPKLGNVPISTYRTTSFFISLPVAIGDYGRVVFSEADFGQWRELGRECSPGDLGRHTLSSGVFVPDLYPTAKTLTDNLSGDLVIGKTGDCHLRHKGDKVEVTTSGAVSATGAVATDIKVKAWVDGFFNAIVPGGVPVVTPIVGNPCPVAVALQTLMIALYPPTGQPSDFASSNLKAD